MVTLAYEQIHEQKQSRFEITGYNFLSTRQYLQYKSAW